MQMLVMLMKNVVRYRKINANSLQSIYDNLLESNFDSIYSCDEVDVGIRSLIEIIQKEYDRVYPIISKTVSYKQTIKPWINYNLLNKIKLRTKYHILYKNGKIGRECYCQYRNSVTSEIRLNEKITT